MLSLFDKFKYVIACDVETASLDAVKDKKVRMHSAAIAYEKDGKLVSVAKPWTKKWKSKLQEYANRDDVLWVFHNAPFDVRVLRLRGVNIRKGYYTDSKLLAYLYDPNIRRYTLDYLTKKFLPRKFHKQEYTGGFDTLTPEMLSYNKQDAVACLALAKHFDNLLSHDEQAYDLYQSIDLPYLEVIIEMEATGFTLDKPALEALEEKYRLLLVSLQNQLDSLVPYVPGKTKEYKKGYHKLAGVVTYNHCQLVKFNPNSTAHIEWALRREGWEPDDDHPKTKTGKLQMSKVVMSKLGGDFELARVLTEYRKYVKLHGTYISKWRERVTDDNKIFGHFNYSSTLTGRLSSSGGTAGNLQNIPGRGEQGGEIRKLVVAPPGQSLIVGDLSNFEARVLAHYLATLFDDDMLAQVFIRNEDLHQANADRLGIERFIAKTMLYLFLYGGGAEKLAQTITNFSGVVTSVKQAQGYLDKLATNFPALIAFREAVVESLKSNGGILHDKLGRRLVYPGVNSRNKWERLKAERQIVNALHQATNASVLRQLTNACWDVVHKYDGRFVGSIHDEVLVTVPTKYAQVVADEMTKIWCGSEVIAPVPVVTQFKVVPNWKEGK